MEDDYMLDGIVARDRASSRFRPVAWWAGVPVKATWWIMAHHPEADIDRVQSEVNLHVENLLADGIGDSSILLMEAVMMWADCQPAKS